MNHPIRDALWYEINSKISLSKLNCIIHSYLKHNTEFDHQNVRHGDL